jgi:hypothetical protein
MLLSQHGPDFGDLYRMDATASGWKPKLLASKAAYSLSASWDGDIYFPCPGGACELTPDQIAHWSTGQQVTRIVEMWGASFPHRIFRDQFGCLWNRNEISASLSCPGTRHLPGQIVPTSIISPDSSNFLAEAPDGSMLMLGSALIFGRPGAFHVVRARNGLPAGVSAALIAHDGTIWIGAADGLYRFMYPFRLEFWDQQDGVDAPYSLLQKGSSVYASSNGIYHLDAGRQLWRQLPNATRRRRQRAGRLPARPPRYEPRPPHRIALRMSASMRRIVPDF